MGFGGDAFGDFVVDVFGGDGVSEDFFVGLDFVERNIGDLLRKDDRGGGV